MDLLCDLLQCSDTLQQQLIQSRGFLVISSLLEEVTYDVAGRILVLKRGQLQLMLFVW